MSKEKYTHIAVVMDRSGSMSSIAKDMSGGLAAFIAEQKKVEGDATVTFAKFDEVYEREVEWADIKSVSAFELHPRGSTALLDAMGNTMEFVREHIQGMAEAERPSKCVFVFITDGEENASHEYTREQVFQMISQLRSDNDHFGTQFEFTFLGANQDAIQAGASLGVRGGASLNYVATSAGAAGAFNSLTETMTNYRSLRCASFTYSDDQRAQSMGHAKKKSAKQKDDVPPVSPADAVQKGPLDAMGDNDTLVVR